MGRVENAMSTHVSKRAAALDWPHIASELDAHGCATTGVLLQPETCLQLIESYADEPRFRSRIVMARHGFGQGEYKYFAAPLPATVAALRTSFYPPLAEIANRWNEKVGTKQRFPLKLEEFLARCHKAGQTRPTPLLLKYGAGD